MSEQSYSMIEDAHSDGWPDGMSESRNILAKWMTAHGYATGHGDTIIALLHELEWQIEERIEHKCAIAYASAKS